MRCQFKVVVALEDIGVFDSFKEAFRAFWFAVKRQLEQGTSWQVFETMNSIILVIDGTEVPPIDFYQARDLAYDANILVGKGEFSDESIEPDHSWLLPRIKSLVVRNLDEFKRSFLK